ncbi:hypothetical protein JM18_007278 [Phytophthora kernoviae]|uniref:Uncharacterized protein n=2 Tax=Phytophthora kernoviae TaxID=325452 RepID=A0A921V7C6_9STRA|nr:hypothetical protein G195_008889 [Phytophthora kernoviae 00238/432]KAG2519910.1 hypothetical protein JM18_007278 [Phytophthora kernoviae]
MEKHHLEPNASAVDTPSLHFFDGFGQDDDILLADVALDLPDLELLLDSEELGDDLLTSLLPNEDDGEWSATEENSTVEGDNPKQLTAEEQELELVAREIKFLEAQRNFLQFKAESKAGNSNGQKQQHTKMKNELEQEKSGLEIATRRRTMLVDVMRRHKRSVQDLHKLLLQATPLIHYRMTLMTPMETHIRLGKDPAERRRKLLGMRDEKLEAVRRFITLQTRGIDPAREFFYVDTFERFGKFYTVDFSVSLVNGMTVDEVAEVIQDQFVVPRDGVSRLLGCVSNREYFDGVVEKFLHARTVERVDVPLCSGGDRGFVVQESNAVFYLKRFAAGEVDHTEGSPREEGDLTVMMSDFVDVDELHPYHSHRRLRKDISVGITLRRHIGPGGIEGVVMRRFSFVKHHLQHRMSTPHLVHTLSTRVLLWGQAVRLCIAERRRQKRDAPKRVWNTHKFPRTYRVTPTQPQSRTACAGADMSN